MARRPQPIERQRAKARGDGRTPGGREVVKAQYIIAKREDAPPMPRGLRTRGRREWIKIWDSGPWLNPEQDYAWVEQISRAYDDMDIFRKKVTEDGLVVTGYAGQVVAHPLLAEIRKCEETIRKCLSILGYSPTDRARLGIAEIKRETALQEFIKVSRENQAPAANADPVWLQVVPVNVDLFHFPGSRIVTSRLFPCQASSLKVDRPEHRISRERMAHPAVPLLHILRMPHDRPATGADKRVRYSRLIHWLASGDYSMHAPSDYVLG